MLIDAVKGNDNAVVARNAGLAAFEAAIVQQQAFEETLEKLAERHAAAQAENERRKAEEESKAASSEQAVSVVLNGKQVETEEPGGNNNAPENGQQAQSPVRGKAVNISV